MLSSQSNARSQVLVSMPLKESVALLRQHSMPKLRFREAMGSGNAYDGPEKSINIIGQQENLWGCLQKHTRSAKTACNDV